jgi:hypothetical protein
MNWWLFGILSFLVAFLCGAEMYVSIRKHPTHIEGGNEKKDGTNGKAKPI